MKNLKSKLRLKFNKIYSIEIDMKNLSLGLDFKFSILILNIKFENNSVKIFNFKNYYH